MCVTYLFLEDFDFVWYIVTTASIRGRWAISATLWDATMPVFSGWGLHAQVSPVILTIIPVLTICVTASKEWVKEITSQSLRTDLVIASIHVYWLLKAKGVNTL